MKMYIFFVAILLTTHAHAMEDSTPMQSSTPSTTEAENALFGDNNPDGEEFQVTMPPLLRQLALALNVELTSISSSGSSVLSVTSENNDDDANDSPGLAAAIATLAAYTQPVQRRQASRSPNTIVRSSLSLSSIGTISDEDGNQEEEPASDNEDNNDEEFVDDEAFFASFRRASDTQGDDAFIYENEPEAL